MKNKGKYCPADNLVDYLKSKDVIVKESGNQKLSGHVRKAYRVYSNENLLSSFTIKEDNEISGLSQKYIEWLFLKIKNKYNNIEFDISDIEFFEYPNEYLEEIDSHE